jgi:hypothetical protein
MRMLAALEDGVKGGKWFSLIDKVWPEKTLRKAFGKVAANQGAPGVDRVTIEMFEGRLDDELRRLSDQLRDGTYRPQAIRRHYIPKPGSQEKRPLGIPTVRDRVVQTAMRMVLEPIFERDFAEQSYGFRPGRGCKDALRRVDELLKADYTYIVDADLKSYFDTIPHDRLMALVSEKVSDGRILTLIEVFLKQGVMDGLREWTPEMGSPQGAVITPPTTLQRTLLGAPLKRGWADPVHDADLVLVDLDLLHQSPNDLPSRGPVRLLQLSGDPLGELLQLTDHQTQFLLPSGLVHPLVSLFLQFGQPLARRQDPRLEFRLVEQPLAVGIDQTRYHFLHIDDHVVEMLRLTTRPGLRPLQPPLVLRPDSLGLGQEMTHVVPDGGVQDIGADRFVPTQSLAAEAVGVGPRAAVVGVVKLPLGRGPAHAHQLTVAAVAAPLADDQALEEIPTAAGPFATAVPVLLELSLDRREQVLIHQCRDIDEDLLLRRCLDPSDGTAGLFGTASMRA